MEAINFNICLPFHTYGKLDSWTFGWAMLMPVPKGKHSARRITYAFIQSVDVALWCSAAQPLHRNSMTVFHSIMCAKHVYLLWLSGSHVAILIFLFFTHKISSALFNTNVHTSAPGFCTATPIYLNNRRHRRSSNDTQWMFEAYECY